MDSERPTTSKPSRPVSRNGPSSPFRMTMHILPPSPSTLPLREDLRISPIRSTFMSNSTAGPSSPIKETSFLSLHAEPSRSGMHASIDDLGSSDSHMPSPLYESSPAQSEMSRMDDPLLSMTVEVLSPPPRASTPTPHSSRHNDHTSHPTPISSSLAWHDALGPLYFPVAPDSQPLESSAQLPSFEHPTPSASDSSPAFGAAGNPFGSLDSTSDLLVGGAGSISAPILLASSSNVSRPLLTSEPLNRSVPASSSPRAPLPPPLTHTHTVPSSVSLVPGFGAPSLPLFVPTQPRAGKRRRANSLPTLEPDYKRTRTGRAHSPLPSEPYARSLRPPRPIVNKLEHQRQRASLFWQRLLDLRTAEMRKYIRSVRLVAPLEIPSEETTTPTAAMMEAFGILPFGPTPISTAGGERHSRKTLRLLLARSHMLPRLAYHLSLAVEPATAVHGPDHDLFWEAVSVELETGCRCLEWEGRYDARAGYTHDAVVRRRIRRSECICIEAGSAIPSRLPALLTSLKARIMELLGPETAHHLSLPCNLAEIIDPYLPQVQEAFALLEPGHFMSLAASGQLCCETEHSNHLGRVMSFLVMSLGAQVERLIGLHAIRRAAEDGKWGKALRRCFALIRKLEMDQFMRRLLDSKRIEPIARQLEGDRLRPEQKDQVKMQIYEASKRVLLDTPLSERAKLFDSALPGSSVRVPTRSYAVKAFSEMLCAAASDIVGPLPEMVEENEQLARSQGALFRMQQKAAVLAQIHQEVQQCETSPRWLEQGVQALLDKPGLIEQALPEIAMLVTMHLRQTDTFSSVPLTTAELAGARSLQGRLRASLSAASATRPRLQKALSMLVVEELGDLIPISPVHPVAPVTAIGTSLSPSPCPSPCCQPACQPHISSSPSNGAPTPRCASPVPLARAALEPGVVFRPHSLYGTMPPLVESGYALAQRLLAVDGLAGLMPELESVAEELSGTVRYLYGVWGKEMRYTRVMAGAAAAVKLAACS